MHRLTPDLPLLLRCLLVALGLMLGAWGFATGSVVIGLLGIALTGWLFHRIFLLDAGREGDE